MSQIPALFLPPTRSVNVKKTSVKPNTSKKKSNKQKGSMNEQKKNDVQTTAAILRTKQQSRSVVRLKETKIKI